VLSANFNKLKLRRLINNNLNNFSISEVEDFPPLTILHQCTLLSLQEALLRQFPAQAAVAVSVAAMSMLAMTLIILFLSKAPLPLLHNNKCINIISLLGISLAAPISLNNQVNKI
jgi:hypothetical protein